MTDPSRPSCSGADPLVSCKDCAEFLMDYLDGVLPQEEQLKFQSHIERCYDCHVYLENYRKTAKLAASIGKADPKPPEVPVPRRLVEAILAARKKQP